jgi:outer membrane protein OmpA-like peptidoglycan-associated protein
MAGDMRRTLRATAAEASATRRSWLGALLLVALAGLVVASPAPAAPVLTTQGLVTVGNGPLDVAVGDVNADGELDIVAADSTGRQVTVLFGPAAVGSPSSRTQDVAPGGIATAIALADFDRDGLLDVALGLSSDSVAIALGGGDGSFAGGGNAALGFTPRKLAVADFDRDGRPDVAAMGPDGAGSLLLTNPDGTLQSPKPFTGPPNGVLLAAANMNGDSFPDLVAVGQEAAVRVFLGLGDGTFSGLTPTPLAEVPLSATVGDLNRDGRSDVAAQLSSSIAALPGVGDGTFQAPVFSPDGALAPATLADMDGDAWLDFIGVASTGDVEVLSGSGATFAPGATSDGNAGPWALAVADLNRDGRPELVQAVGGAIRIHNNESQQAGAQPNTAPRVAIAGASADGMYVVGSLQPPVCNIADSEDAVQLSQPARLSAVSGPRAGEGLGSQTAGCAYTDSGGLAAKASVGYTIIAKNTPPTVTMSGLVAEAVYAPGAEPDVTCNWSDVEDGARQFPADRGPIVGPRAASGLGTRTVTCTRADTGGLTATASAAYAIAVTIGNQRPTVNLDGVKEGGLYPFGSVPARCFVSDAEDGQFVKAADLSPVSGPASDLGIGSQTATCSYTDKGGLAAPEKAVTFLVEPAASAAGPPGSLQAVTGAGFGALQGASMISFGDAQASVVTWRNDRIDVFVPNIAPGIVDIVGTIDGRPRKLLRFNVLPPEPQPPVANLIVLPASGTSVTFDATLSVDPDGRLSAPRGSHGEASLLPQDLLVEWNFGDGTRSNKPMLPHPFPHPGTYTVSLTVTDRSGMATTAHRKVTVNPKRRFVSTNVSIPSQIVFDFGSAALRPESSAYLRRIAGIVRRGRPPTRIAGYTDSVGPSDYNLRLSMKRARVVRSFLARKGHVSAARMAAQGYGETRPLATNATEIGRQRNRRVIVTVELPTGIRRV